MPFTLGTLVSPIWVFRFEREDPLISIVNNVDYLYRLRHGIITYCSWYPVEFNAPTWQIVSNLVLLIVELRVHVQICQIRKRQRDHHLASLFLEVDDTEHQFLPSTNS